jgi:hypothetical protein
MEHLARFRKSGRQAVRQRAQILMASVVYTPVSQIARICQTDEAHVRKVIYAFNEVGFESLNPKVGPGRPRTFEPAIRERILGIALASPKQASEPLTRQHARSAVGLVALPFDIPVEIEAEVEIDWPANWSPVCSGSGRAGGRIEWSHFGWRWRECGAGKTCGLPGSGRCARDVTAQETLDSGGSSTLAVAVRLD